MQFPFCFDSLFYWYVLVFCLFRSLTLSCISVVSAIDVAMPVGVILESICNYTVIFYHYSSLVTNINKKFYLQNITLIFCQPFNYESNVFSAHYREIKQHTWKKFQLFLTTSLIQWLSVDCRVGTDKLSMRLSSFETRKCNTSQCLPCYMLYVVE